MNLTYTRKGDYLYPDLTIESEAEPIGMFGLMRKAYLKENKPDRYQSMLLSGSLDRHLAETDRQAQERFETILAQLTRKDPAPDKEKDQLGWTRHMNSLTETTREIVLSELVYA